MTFEDEIKLFYEWVQICHETNPIGGSAINLWNALMHTWLNAGFPHEFAVARSTLEKKTGLKKDTIYDARNKLKQVGRIDWTERKGNLSAIYKIVSFKQTQTPTQWATQTPTQTAHIISSSNNYINTPTTNYNVSIKPTQVQTQELYVGLTDTNTDTSQAEINQYNPFKHYEQLFGLLRFMAIEEIKDYLNHGLEKRLVCLAMDRSHEHGARHWSYAKRILDRCVIEKICTVEAFLKDEEQHHIQIAAKKAGKFEGVNQGGNSTGNSQSNGEKQDDPYKNIKSTKL